MTTRLSLLALAAITIASASTLARTQSSSGVATPPDFSGVYYPVNAQGGGGARAGAPRAPQVPAKPLPPPTRTAPLSDGSRGRGPDAPQLTPEYMKKWEAMRDSRIAGSSVSDNTAKCLPPGMPAMMNMAYGMEIMQTKDKVTFFSELNDALRRVYLDGRKPTPAILDDPTYAGYSTGHWEGDTLVVETVALRDNTYIEGFTPHSDQMTVRERIRLLPSGLLEDRITVADPKALVKPWETVKTYRKAAYPNDQLREFACAEGLDNAH
jgi:hypothetical protein